MYKSILVPIDMSHGEIGRRIAERARALADKGAEITLLYVMDDEVPPYATTYVLPASKLEANVEEMKSELNAIARAGGVKATTIVRLGKPSPIILDEADALGSDLIILASHRPGLQDYLIGSTASRVVRHAKCSVLIDRQEMRIAF